MNLNQTILVRKLKEIEAIWINIRYLFNRKKNIFYGKSCNKNKKLSF